jgi:hypothetical protein
MSCLKISPPGCGTSNLCGECPPCPDFQIKRHDTKPPFKASVEDEKGDPFDLTDLVLEASMWTNAKLKKDILAADTELQLVDNIGFDQIMAGDIMVADRVRSPEYMLITGFDETNKIIFVDRGFDGTTPDNWKKGTKLKIFRFMNSPATTEMVYEDVLQVDGTTLEDQLIESFLVYEWNPQDTCVPGCFWLEFKLLKLTTDPTPSVTPVVCSIGDGVEWVRRFPTCGEYLIKICDSPTAEVVA